MRALARVAVCGVVLWCGTQDAWTDVIDPAGARVEIDWTAGQVRAVGAGAANIRAPGPDIARIGAERVARQDAAKRLAEAARALPAGGLDAGGSGGGAGATVGQAVDADPGAAARFAAAVERARDVKIDYSSDGSVEVTLALPLEAIRTALSPQPTPAASDTAPTAVVIDATAAKIAPALGVALTAGDVRYAGPTVWTRDAAAAAKDPRAGGRVVNAKATAAATAGALAIDLPSETLAAARGAGALVIVIIEKDKKPKTKPVK